MEANLTRLRQIQAVARCRSFSRAAEELNITQPALSRSVAAFEHEYGIRLFDRGRSGAIPTAVGALVVAEAAIILQNASNLDHNLRLFRLGEAGKIAFGLGPLLASVLLPTLSTLLLQSRPQLQLRSSIKAPEQLLVELLNDEIELFYANPFQVSQAPEVVIEPLGSLELAMVVRSGHPLLQMACVTLADIAAYPSASSVERPSGNPGATLGGGFVCDNSHILRETVLGTDCVWLTAPAFVSVELQCGKLARLEVLDLLSPESQISMIHRHGRSLSPAALVITDEVKSLLCEIDKKLQ